MSITLLQLRTIQKQYNITSTERYNACGERAVQQKADHSGEKRTVGRDRHVQQELPE